MISVLRKTEAELKAITEPIANAYYYRRYIQPYLAKKRREVNDV